MNPCDGVASAGGAGGVGLLASGGAGDSGTPLGTSNGGAGEGAAVCTAGTEGMAGTVGEVGVGATGLGLLDAVPSNPKADVNVQMKMAIEKIAFLPFGLLIDKWRWDVFSGKVKEGEWNKAWWELRTKYQGVSAPVTRSEADFDPGAKYHIPGSTPYIRYFLARIYQFQFYKALCEASGHKGALNTCSFFGSKEAGTKLKNMLALGASKPWPEAMKAITGDSKADASALVEYFAPLRSFLKEQTGAEKCGW